MDKRGGDDERNNGGRRRAAPNSNPSLKVFLPYVLLAVVLVLGTVWMYGIGPAGDAEDRGQLLHQNTEQVIDPTAEGDDEVEVAEDRDVD